MKVQINPKPTNSCYLKRLNFIMLSLIDFIYYSKMLVNIIKERFYIIYVINYFSLMREVFFIMN